LVWQKHVGIGAVVSKAGITNDGKVFCVFSVCFDCLMWFLKAAIKFAMTEEYLSAHYNSWVVICRSVGVFYNHEK